MDRGKFLLVMPEYSDFPELFIRNLTKIGFEASLITDDQPGFAYKGAERMINFFKKTFLKDKEYKKTLVNRFKERKFLEIAYELRHDFDHILVIRPDQFPVSFIEQLKDKTRNLIAYQWDGVEKFPSVKKYIPLFDSFYCFESVPGVNSIKQITNFYFDFDEVMPDLSVPKHDPPVLYFVGLDWEIRREKIYRFINFANQKNLCLKFYLQEFDKNPAKNPSINYIKNRISFAENLERVQKADILLDFIDPRHTGLSIRFFEALRYRKKMITDNTDVQTYDFYHPQNIFILGVDDADSLVDFINSGYLQIDEQIVQKYSFTNWIATITAHSANQF